MNCIADAVSRLHEAHYLLKAYKFLLPHYGLLLLNWPLLLHMSTYSCSFLFFRYTLDSILAKDLQYEVFYYRSHTFSEYTKHTYKSYIDSYTRFCLLMNIPAVPASTHNIGMYAGFLARSMKPSSVRQYVKHHWFAA